ncbi:YkgJ family cysteine cluster protein [Paucibacter sp. APW11]|uniref:YkgJ family cysteine cluster protein n=1 Tax=Roseateles aquae TaxID=3077235 RepID=A0ABU3PDL3_9BURK|nr:YkgJ family cysteine cluster protein [Paucibacter sp. APW11]MDT9000656.1 YkgJ family cysteine cluster protein [Paucibacter sp. APW11]
MREPHQLPAGIDLDCTRCGACCAQYRVSFYWAEAAARGLDEALTESLNPWLSCMKGTSSKQPRCVALAGTIGEQVACTVYEQRPEVCRELQAGQPQCLKARAAFGLA